MDHSNTHRKREVVAITPGILCSRTLFGAATTTTTAVKVSTVRHQMLYVQS